MTRGVLYKVTGERFVREAAQSAESVHAQMPAVETAIATTDVHLDLGVFDRVIELDVAEQRTVNGRQWLIDSTIDPDLSPFERTLYLDSDTYLCEDVTELFDLLDQFDMAVSRVPNQPAVEDLPEPWNLYNCGVILYRDSSRTREFLNRWMEVYHDMIAEQDQPEDQPAFVKALYESERLRWYTLPRRYNVRFPRVGSLANRAKIIHGRPGAGRERVATELNRSERLRIFRPHSYRSTPATVVHDRATLRYYLEQSIATQGLGYTVKRGFGYVVDELFGTNLQQRLVDTDKI
jgi:hypothetical protein